MWILIKPEVNISRIVIFKSGCFVQNYYWPGTRGSWSLVQGYFLGPWRNIDFSEKYSPLNKTDDDEDGDRQLSQESGQVRDRPSLLVDPLLAPLTSANWTTEIQIHSCILYYTLYNKLAKLRRCALGTSRDTLRDRCDHVPSCVQCLPQSAVVRVLQEHFC